MKILDKKCYETALKRLDELEMLVTESTLKTDANYLEMDELIDAIDAYDEPSLSVARRMSRSLNIDPAVVLGV